MEHKINKGGITRFWWIPLLTGLLSIAIGIWCLFNPVESLPTLAYAFAICVIIAGIFNFTFSFVNSGLMSGWGWYLAYGLIEVLCGVWLITLPLPVLTTVFIYAIGLYLIFIAINAICESCMLYSYSRSWIGWLIALLLITIIFAFIFMAGPIAGGIAVWLYIGISFICYGIFKIILSAKFRKLNKLL